ncbi:MerR family transcriptional regulator [Streptomyces sp. NPDC048257]|uniref:helix-turn-helix domain-containing protein n=1 Tax=Streptomyces sp. NPDC048257 TaxID=3365526 RepID=UPI00371BA5B7
MTTVLPRTTREVRLAAVPEGLPAREHFTVAVTPRPEPGPGQVLERRGLLSPPARTASGQREYGTGEIARVRVIRDLLALGLTIEDLRGCADRLHLLAQDPPPRCGADAPGGPAPGVAGRTLAALDAETDRLAALRENLARRAFGDD